MIEAIYDYHSRGVMKRKRRMMRVEEGTADTEIS
jgi:hypothetical protein